MSHQLFRGRYVRWDWNSSSSLLDGDDCRLTAAKARER
jgi:hypothetical protein